MLIVPETYYVRNSNIFFHYYEYEGQMWYSYYHISSMLGYSDDGRKDTWNNKLNDNEKLIFEEEFTDWRKNVCKHEVQYINTVALFKLLDKYEKIAGDIRYHVRILEKEKGYYEDKKHVLKVDLGLLEQYINDNNANDYNKLRSLAKNVCESEQIRQFKNSDSVKEEIINEFRNDIYACEDITEVEWNIKMVNKYEMTEEERKAKYKRAKDIGLNTNAPAWLKDIIK